MIRQYLLFFLTLLWLEEGHAQKPGRSRQYDNFPIVLGIQFHSIGKPFHRMADIFSNPGFTIGTEVGLGSSHTWAQTFQLGWYRNRNAGNGLMVYTQSVYRPYLAGNSFAEVKAGFGWLRTKLPSRGLAMGDGKWTSPGRFTKNMLMIPAGIGLGYNGWNNSTYVAPTISYQGFLSGVYNQSFPILWNSLLQGQTRIHFFKSTQ